MDHSAFFPDAFASPQDVTRACLRCHPDAASDFLKTAHWQWLGPEVKIPGHDRPQRIGKANLLNNFCLTTVGNWPSCTKCHAGYGWENDSYDFSRVENVDCLVCHEWSRTYVKGNAGLPAKGVNLQAVAKSVGYPKRANCSVCHSYGGGGQAVKHGDLDGSLENPTEYDDVHMAVMGSCALTATAPRSTISAAGRSRSVSRTATVSTAPPAIRRRRTRTRGSTRTCRPWPVRRATSRRSRAGFRRRRSGTGARRATRPATTTRTTT